MRKKNNINSTVSWLSGECFLVTVVTSIKRRLRTPTLELMQKKFARILSATCGCRKFAQKVAEGTRSFRLRIIRDTMTTLNVRNTLVLRQSNRRDSKSLLMQQKRDFKPTLSWLNVLNFVVLQLSSSMNSGNLSQEII